MYQNGVRWMENRDLLQQLKVELVLIPIYKPKIILFEMWTDKSFKVRP